MFSKRLIEIRKNKKLSQTTVALSIGKTLRTYQKYEASEIEPTLSVLIALADFFVVSLDYLCGRIETE